jgi:hypothetical protein
MGGSRANGKNIRPSEKVKNVREKTDYGRNGRFAVSVLLGK